MKQGRTLDSAGDFVAKVSHLNATHRVNNERNVSHKNKDWTFCLVRSFSKALPDVKVTYKFAWDNQHSPALRKGLLQNEMNAGVIYTGVLAVFPHKFSRPFMTVQRKEKKKQNRIKALY